MTRAALLACTLALACGEPPTTPAGGWRLVWQDEFDGPAGATPDPSRWSLDVGGNGWGNQELQQYTDRPDNAALDGRGFLVITARREVMAGRAYTSARITSRGKFARAYGRFEARLKLPAGRGLWPAFWLLGADINTVSWPACGEIDVVESRGAQPWRVSAAAHAPGYSGGSALTGAYETPDRARFSDDFHLYAVEWDPDQLRFFVDGILYHTVRSTRLPAGAPWPYQHPFFVLLNLAVGGAFGGPPDDTTPFPQALIADHIRVYAR
jgi:beta-glucanase (GH16 family)